MVLAPPLLRATIGASVTTDYGSDPIYCVRLSVLENYNEWHREHPTGDGVWADLVKQQVLSRDGLSVADFLDIGCGRGTLTDWIASHTVGRVVGADFASVAVDHARAHYSRANLSFEIQDIEAISHPTESFDAVVSCETIEHVPDPAKAVREVARVLRPGGVLFLTTPNYMSLNGLHRIYRTATGRKENEGGQPIANFTMYPRTRRWVRLAGLEPVATDGRGFYIPAPRRERPFEWTPPESLRRRIKLLGLHVLIVARKP